MTEPTTDELKARCRELNRRFAPQEPTTCPECGTPYSDQLITTTDELIAELCSHGWLAISFSGSWVVSLWCDKDFGQRSYCVDSHDRIANLHAALTKLLERVKEQSG